MAGRVHSVWSAVGKLLRFKEIKTLYHVFLHIFSYVGKLLRFKEIKTHFVGKERGDIKCRKAAPL